MSTEAERSLLAVLVLAGCVSSSTSGDVARVRELTDVDVLARVADVDVDPATSEEARRLLSRPLDADAAVRIALLNNRGLRASLREIGIARGQLQQAGLIPNPVVEAELLPERDSSIELRIEYDLTSLVLAPTRSRAMALGVEAARYSAAGAVLEGGYRVRTAFYALQAAMQKLVIAQRSLDAFAASRDAARALYEAGNVPELEVANAEASYERARASVARMELDVASARERMQRLLGAHGEATAWTVDGELRRAPAALELPDRLETQALRASLELRGARSSLEQLARRAGFTRGAGWIPDIDIDVHALRTRPEEDGERAEWRYGAGVSVAVPLFDRGQGDAAAIDAELDASMERYYGMAVDIRSAVRDARNRVVSSHARALLYQDTILPAQARVLEQTMLQYNAMQIGVFDVLRARREQLDAEMAYVDTLAEHWSAVAALDVILAGHHVMPDTSEGMSAMPTSESDSGGH